VAAIGLHPRGRGVGVPAGALSAPVRFTLATDAVILDGETSVQGIPIIAALRGTSSNTTAGAITEWVGGVPFPGAAVTNPLPVTSGRDVETPGAYRDRIRRVRASKARATDTAIEQAVLGVTGDDNRTASSVSLVRRPGRPAALFVDDGAGYEPVEAGTGAEVVVDVATGGERDFQLNRRPIRAASLTALNTGPYRLADAWGLAFAVAGVTTTHVFDDSKYPSIAAASPYDVVSDINSDPGLLWSARTVANGTAISVFARSETSDDIAPVSTVGMHDAAPAFRFPQATAATMLLYRNDVLLSKDGRPASLLGRPASTWGALAGPQTLTMAVDSTPAVTYTVTDQAFVDAGTDFSGVGQNTPASWVAVLNATTPGATWSAEGDALRVTSNRGLVAGASISITSGSLIGAGVVVAGVSTGRPRDYTLDRGTGQIVLQTPLLPGDRLVAGSEEPRGQIVAPAGVFDLADAVDAWIAVDAGLTVVPHGVTPTAVVQVTVAAAEPSCIRLAFMVEVPTGGVNPFSEVVPGDWMVLWDPDAPDTWRRAWRVVDTSAGRQDGNDTHSVLVERVSAGATRFCHATAATSSTQFLVCGGYGADPQVDAVTGITKGSAVHSSAEIFNAPTFSWLPTAPMSTPRAHHTASMLPGGRVMVCGGYGPDGAPLATAEVWSPITGLWTNLPSMASTRAEHTATVLASGRVLVVGGFGTGIGSSQEFNPSTNTWGGAVNINTARRSHAAILMPAGAGSGGVEAGNVMIIGGYNNANTAIQSVETYLTASPVWNPRSNMPTGRACHSVGVIDANHFLAVGGGPVPSQLAATQTYTIWSLLSNSWSADIAVDAIHNFRWVESAQQMVSTGGRLILPGGSQTPVGSIAPICGGKYYLGGVWSDWSDGPIAASTRARTCGAAVQIDTSRWLLSGGIEFYANPGSPAYAVSEIVVSNTGAINDPLTVSSTLPHRGLTFVRTAEPLYHTSIPAGERYTASSVAETFDIRGVVAESYRTSSLRIKTVEEATGDVALAAVSSDFPLDPGAAKPSQVCGYGVSVSRSDVGTPQGWAILPDVGTPGFTATGIAAWAGFPFVGTPHPDTIAGFLRRPPAGLNTGSWADDFNPDAPDQTTPTWGSAAGSAETAGIIRVDGSTARLGLRRPPAAQPEPGAPAILATPWLVGADDTTTVIVDGNADTYRFVIPSTRRMIPTSDVYGSGITLRDADAGNAPLSNTFGVNYDWTDYVVLMKARAVSHSGDATRSVVWRYYRHGVDGQSAVVRYAYPQAADSALTIKIGLDQSAATDSGAPGETLALIDIVLRAGAARTATRFHPQTRLGVSRVQLTRRVCDVYVICGFTVTEAQRNAVGGQTRLQLKLPDNGGVGTGPQALGISVGDSLWFEAAASSSALSSGVFTVASIGSVSGGLVNITTNTGSIGDGTIFGITANPGTVSTDTAGEASFDPATIPGDLAALDGPVFSHQWTAAGSGRVMSVGKQYLRIRMLDVAAGGFQPIPSWFATSAIRVFAGPTDTATALAAAITALKGVVVPTVVGDGTGIILFASWDEFGFGDTVAGYRLTDGLNAVQSYTPAGAPGDDVAFTLKLNTAASLASGADWIHEDVRVGPATVDTLARWLQTPAVTGLWTAAEIVATAHRELQIRTLTPGTAGSIEVQGGAGSSATAAVAGSARAVNAANRPQSAVVTVKAGEAAGLPGGAWLSVTPAVPAPRVGFWLPSTTVAFVPTGLVSSAPVFESIYDSSSGSSVGGLRIAFTPCGDFMAVRIGREANSVVNTPTTLDTVANGLEDCLAYVAAEPSPTGDYPAPASGNRGVFRILRSVVCPGEIVLWIQNPAGVAETANCRLKIVGPDSVRPGDIITVGDDTLGPGNRGSWVVTGVNEAGGEQYIIDQIPTTLTLAPNPTPPQTFTGTVGNALTLRAGQPEALVKRVVTVTPNDNPDYADLQLDSSVGIGRISSSLGTVLSAIDKPRFAPGVRQGTDGYRYATGLVGEASRVVYGDPGDEANYPGYAAEGAAITVDGVVIRRFTCTVSIRVNGNPSETTADRVRSAVAAAVNSSGAAGFALGQIPAAALEVPNVTAAAVVFPQYDAGHDVVTVAAGERLKVLDLRSDVRVVFAGL
jgi:hypothetical protein